MRHKNYNGDVQHTHCPCEPFLVSNKVFVLLPSSHHIVWDRMKYLAVYLRLHNPVSQLAQEIE